MHEFLAGDGLLLIEILRENIELRAVLREELFRLLVLRLDERDDRVDELFETVKRDLVDLIMQNPKNADQAILFMMIAKYLERIGDHAVNIGEWVEYASTGVRG